MPRRGLIPALALGLALTPAAVAAAESAAETAERAEPPVIAIEFDGPAWSPDETPTITGLLRGQLARRGIRLDLGLDPSAAATVTVAASEPDRIHVRVAGVGAEPPIEQAHVVPEAGEERAASIARAVFGALAPVGAALRSQAPLKPLPKAPGRPPSPLDVAIGADVVGYTAGLVEVRGTAEVRGWPWPRWGFGARLNAGQMVETDDDEVGRVRSFSVGGGPVVLFAILPRTADERFRLLARAELELVDRDYGTEGSLAFEDRFGLSGALGVEAGARLSPALALHARGSVGAPFVNSRAVSETGREVARMQGLQLAGAIVVVWNVGL